MLKYVDTLIGFREIPDEISLCINISGCKNACPNCHSPWLANDIGEELSEKELHKLIMKNTGITCVCFMGGDSDTECINTLAKSIRNSYPELKIAWYSGKPIMSQGIELKNFDFIKLGPYIEANGGLDNPNTNQRLYEVCRLRKLPDAFGLSDVTSKFWKNG